jgi:alpha-L-arabinofuranosidase
MVPLRTGCWLTWALSPPELMLAVTMMAGMAVAQLPRSAFVTIHDKQTGPHVGREIFSQFAEQLGTGIYGGLWVGRDSPIPNEDGFRRDVLDALSELDVPLVRWPGGAMPTSITVFAAEFVANS